MKMWEEMKAGSAAGIKTCLRVKLDYKNVNGALRDPVIYRCKPEEHIRYSFHYQQFELFKFVILLL